ncbi:MAG: MmcQ/YjbR family DNA-binding protein [Campylobacteraceae bacterium]|nr:MmcQ/YjbR family DNA-binding protein [Campylobacteraceae bacterium]
MITFQTIEKIASKQQGALKEYKPSWDSTLFWIGSRMFLLIMHDDEMPMMNFKNDPFINIHLREKYPEITAGYHMNKKHWNTLYYKNSNLDIKFLEQLIYESYETVFNSLTKKERFFVETKL